MTAPTSAIADLDVPPAPPAPAPRWQRLRRRLWHPDGQPAWARPALVALLLGTAVLYIWGLGASGWANAFYSAAAQAGSVSWKAFFYGASDAGNSITVDKTPASLWLTALSVRLFGLSSWSILVPEALAGVAAVGALYATVRRWYGAGAGLLAGAVMALTPVAVLMFRFNNPDALLVLLLVLGGYATVRAVESGRTRWIVAVGALVGFAFLTKMLQAFLVVPAFALTYLVAAPGGVLRRVRDLLLSGLATVVAAGWWVAIVELVPAAWRPYIGGSQNNSVLELTFGYNGFGRITGEEVGSVTGGPAGGPAGGNAGMWGETGWTRLFNAENGGQVSWLIPAALMLLVAGLVLAGRAPRTDRVRAGFVLWGGWLVVTMATFSFMAGIFHPYYNVALAPAIGALVGMGATVLWRRHDRAAMLTLAGVIAVTAVWASVLLGRNVDWQTWLAPTILAVGLGAALILALAQLVQSGLASRLATAVVVAAGLGAGLAGPAAYAFYTVATDHGGAIPSAGPMAAGARGGPGGRGPGGQALPGGQVGPGGLAVPPDGQRPGAVPPGGVAPGGGQRPDGRMLGTVPGGQFQGPGGAGGRGGPGGLLNAGTPSAQIIALLKADAGDYTWVAATIGANNAAGYQLASGEAVMPIGGFNGSDPSPTLEQFQQYVAEHRIHYFLGGGGFNANGGSRTAQQIAAWVTANFTATTVGGVTVYDLS